MLSYEGLVCPECKENLSRESSSLKCAACSKSYRVREGIPCFVELDPAALPFKQDYLDAWFQRESTHFWNVVRQQIIYRFTAPFLRARFPALQKIEAIEIGVGTGNVPREFIKHGIPMQGADLFYNVLTYCRSRFDMPLYQADILKLPFREKFDFIGVYDILEHLEDDCLAIRNLHAALKRGGLLNVTVPACKALWSSYDELDHKRRYSKKELVARLEKGGFKILRSSYFMTFLFPVVFALRRIQKYSGRIKLQDMTEFRIIPAVNTLFRWVFGWEKFWLRFLDFPFGASLIVVAEKV